MTSQRSSHKGILLESGTNEVEFLLFQLGAQRYGINVSKVCQILLFDASKIATVPKQGSDVVGLMTFREKSISVIDLRAHLQISRVDGSLNRDLLLVTEFNQRTTAFIIDSVDRIERCDWSQYEPITDTVCNNGSSTVVGSVTLKDGIVVILDLESVLSTIDPSMDMTNFEAKIGPGSIERSDVSLIYCEDSPLIQKVLLQTLKRAGFNKIKVFNTGADGFEYLKNASPDSVDIILSDIEMPKMDGLTLCKNVKQIDGFQKVPFVFFSSLINEQMETKCKQVGGNACFSKPQIHLIVSAIEELLSTKQS